MNKYKYGLFAEYCLIICLFLRGYKILKRRYKTFCGEIDILATRNKDLVAFEVKARKDNKTSTDIVSINQRERIYNSLKVFISENNKYVDYNIFYNIILFRNIFNFKIYR